MPGPLAEDAEFQLAAGAWRATVSPMGASLRRLWLERPGAPLRDILWGYSGTANKKGGQGDVLLPWPGRIAGGTYEFEGGTHHLPKNDKDGPNAIHGFLRTRAWQGEQQGAGVARFRTHVTAKDHAGYPFQLEVAVGYELLDSGLACAVVARNDGLTPAPFGAGFHPYFLADLATTPLQVPASKVVPFKDLLPTGDAIDVPPDLDFRVPRPVGATRLNHCLTGLEPAADGFTRVRLGDVEVWMDASFRYVVLYTGDALGPDARRALAIEPMTCATDGFNHPEWGLTVLEPGDAMMATWGISLARAAPT